MPVDRFAQALCRDGRWPRKGAEVGCGHCRALSLEEADFSVSDDQWLLLSSTTSDDGYFTIALRIAILMMSSA